MPTYEYRCPKGHEFELFQRITDPPAAVCPECGAEAQRLLSTGAGVLFKGSGFYATDYRPEGYKKAAEAEKGESGKAEGKPGGEKAEGKSGGAAGADAAKKRGKDAGPAAGGAGE